MRALLLMLGLLPLGAAAQGITAAERTTSTAQNLTNVAEKKGELVAFTSRDEEINGSPMLLPEWRLGEVLLFGNQRPMPARLKYDLYRQQLRVLRPQGDSVVMPLAQLQEFWLREPGPARHFVNYRVAPPAESGRCAELLVDGPAVQLVKYQHKALVSSALPPSSYAPAASAQLVEQTHYYLRWPGDGRFAPIKLKRASLEQALAGYGPAVAALKARKGSLSAEAELVSALTELEPLLAAPSR